MYMWDCVYVLMYIYLSTCQEWLEVVYVASNNSVNDLDYECCT